jgi:hypothetical protein
MLQFRRLFLVTAVAVLVLVAASLAFTQLSPSPAASSTSPALAEVQTRTTAPTKTTFIFPTLAVGSGLTSTALLPTIPSVPPTPTPAIAPSDTPLPPTSTPSATPVPANPVAFLTAEVEAPATDTLTPLEPPEDAETAVTYTVTISDVFGRREPVMDSNQYQALKRGQSYTVTAQSADGIWLNLQVPRVNEAVWVPAAFGLTHGDRDEVPFANSTQIATSEPVSAEVEITPEVEYPYLSAISLRARDVYRYGLLLGNNPHTFMKIGDCQTIFPFFLSAFDNPKSYQLGNDYGYLQAAIWQFSGSFGRDSVAAQTGFGTATELDPQWANPNACLSGESPLVCEYRTMRPSLAIISLGTNDIWQPDGRHELNMRKIIDYLIHQGVVPILSTKADNVEGDGSFNRLIVQLAGEYQLPLWDFWQVTRGLPKYGLVDTYHLSWGPSVFDDPKNMRLGWPWRNLSALQALDAVWRAVR